MFFFNDTATTEIYTLSLHDALPILDDSQDQERQRGQHVEREHRAAVRDRVVEPRQHAGDDRSEEHTSELQSRQYLVCRLLLEKKKTSYYPINSLSPYLLLLNLTTAC